MTTTEIFLTAALFISGVFFMIMYFVAIKKNRRLEHINDFILKRLLMYLQKAAVEQEDYETAKGCKDLFDELEKNKKQ